MPDTGLVLNPDDKPIYEALRAGGVPEDLAYTAVQRIRDMAAANLIARFESKLDTLNGRFESKLDAQNAMIAAQNAKLNMLMWMVGAAVAVIGILVRFWG